MVTTRLARWHIGVVLAAAACGGASAISAPDRAADRAACDEVATRELAITSLSFIQPLHVALRERCADDRWSLAVRQCVLAATTFDELTACHDQLEPAQRAAYERELRGSAEPALADPPAPNPEVVK